MSQRPTLATNQGEAGYALIAAVASIALFGAVALMLASATRNNIATGAAEIARAKATAAADAGIAIALHGLVARDADILSLLDGRSREVQLGDTHITIRLFDERGKVPLNHIDEPEVTRMLEVVGLEGAQLAIARDSLLDWIDSDDEPRANGAEAPDYARQGIAPRNSNLLSIDELARIRGFSPALIAKLRPIVTVDPDAIPFDASHAQPLAIEAMSTASIETPDVIEAKREASGQRTALAFTENRALVGRLTRP